MALCGSKMAQNGVARLETVVRRML